MFYNVKPAPFSAATLDALTALSAAGTLDAATAETILGKPAAARRHGDDPPQRWPRQGSRRRDGEDGRHRRANAPCQRCVQGAGTAHVQHACELPPRLPDDACRVA